MSPIILQVLLHHYATPDPHPDSSRAAANARQFLLDQGLVTMTGLATAKVTDRGETFVKMLLGTPLPEKRWVDPRGAA